MIEQAMIFALGFLVAGLAALAFAPAFWQRADRLTRRRLEMQMPVSVQEILAERDQLRAEFAVERCRLDQRAEKFVHRHASDLAEIGRRASEIAELNAKLAESEAKTHAVEEARAEIARQFTATQAEAAALHKAFYDIEGLMARKQDDLIEQTRLQESMKMLADMRHAALAASEARVASLELRLGDVSRTILEAEQKAAEKERHARSLADVLATTRHNLELTESKLAALRQKLESETALAAKLNDDLASLRQQHEADLSQLRNLMVKMNVNEAALADARRREKDILAQRDQLAERARESERGLSEKYISLRSEYAATQGALEVARRRCAELETTLANWRVGTEAQKTAAAQSEDDATLRQSISDLGAAIVRMMRPSSDAPAPNGAGTRAPALLSPPTATAEDAGPSHAASPEPLVTP